MKLKDKEISVFGVISTLILISGITIFFKPVVSIVCAFVVLILVIYWTKGLSDELIQKACKQKTGKEFYGNTKDSFNILLGLNGVCCLIHVIKFFTSEFDLVVGLSLLFLLVSIGILVYMRKDFVDLGKVIL